MISVKLPWPSIETVPVPVWSAWLTTLSWALQDGSWRWLYIAKTQCFPFLFDDGKQVGCD